MTGTPSLAPSSARASPTRRFRSSDSTTHGPAMRNGEDPKCDVTSVVSPDERGPSLRRGDRSVPRAPELARRADESREQRVRTRGPGLELRVELAADEPGVIGELDHLDQRAVGRESGAAHAVLREDVAVGVGDLVAVAVPLAHLERAVRLSDARARAELAGIRPQPHGAPHLLDPFLRAHQRDDRILALGGEFA